MRPRTAALSKEISGTSRLQPLFGFPYRLGTQLAFENVISCELPGYWRPFAKCFSLPALRRDPCRVQNLSLSTRLFALKPRSFCRTGTGHLATALQQKGKNGSSPATEPLGICTILVNKGAPLYFPWIRRLQASPDLCAHSSHTSYPRRETRPGCVTHYCC